MNLYILDTDTLTLFRSGHPQITMNVQLHPMSELAVAILSVEEQLAGWFTQLRRAKARDQLARAYLKLGETVVFLRQFEILTFNEPAILRFESLLHLKLGVAGMDLRIAAVSLEHGATVVTRNIRDFGRVPGLIVEDWSV